VLSGLPLQGCSKLESYTPQEVSDAEAGDTFKPARYWALKQVTTTVVNVPFLSGIDALAAQSFNYYVLEWRQEGDTIYQDELLCVTEISEVMGVQTVVPDQFYIYHGFQTRKAEVSTMKVGADYIAPDNLSVYGAALDDPWSDPLPTSATSSTELDSDQDGSPGFTSVITGWLGDGYAEVYVAQRSVTTMSGQVVSNDRIEGNIAMDLEQVILGASEGDEWAAADGYESVQDPDPSHNFFILQALSGSMTCDQLLSQKDTLFD